MIYNIYYILYDDPLTEIHLYLLSMGSSLGSFIAKEANIHLEEKIKKVKCSRMDFANQESDRPISSQSSTDRTERDFS